MKILVLLIVLLSSALIGCSTTGKGKEILKERAAFRQEMSDLSLGVTSPKSKKLTQSGVAHAWRHETELPGGDYLGLLE